MPGAMGWSGGFSMPSMGWTPYGGMSGMANMPGGIASMAQPLIAAAQGANQGQSGNTSAIPAAMKLAQRNRPQGMQGGGAPPPAPHPAPHSARTIIGSPFDVTAPVHHATHGLPPHLRDFPPPVEPGLLESDEPLLRAMGYGFPKVLPKMPYEPIHEHVPESGWDPVHVAKERMEPEEKYDPRESYHEFMDRERERMAKRKGRKPKPESKEKHRRGGRTKRALALAKRRK